MSLADKMRAKKEALEAAKKEAEEEGMSLAEKMKAKREAAGEESKEESLADKLRAGSGDAPRKIKPEASLAEQMRARKGKGKGDVDDLKATLADRMRGKDDDEGDIDEDDDSTLGDEDTTALEELWSELQGVFSEMNDRVKLTSIVEEIGELGNTLEQLPTGIEEIRERGYIFSKFLEDKVVVMAEQWDDLDSEVKTWVREESDDLETRLDRAEKLIEKISEHANPTAAKQALVNRLDTILDNLDDKIDAAEDHVEGLYSALEREVLKTKQQLIKIAKLLQEKEEASFDFLAGESVYDVAKAEYDDGGKKPDGNMFITDQRIIFEQKEKTGGTLGFGKKAVQEHLWDVPLSSIEEVKSEDRGMFGGKDMVTLVLGSGAPFREITVEVKGGIDSKVWAREIQKMVKGDVDRAVEPDPELIERLRQAPTDCPTCGGTLPQIMQGQSEVTCKYCGTVIRI